MFLFLFCVRSFVCLFPSCVCVCVIDFQLLPLICLHAKHTGEGWNLYPARQQSRLAAPLGGWLRGPRWFCNTQARGRQCTSAARLGGCVPKRAHTGAAHIRQIEWRQAHGFGPGFKFKLACVCRPKVVARQGEQKTKPNT